MSAQNVDLIKGILPTEVDLVEVLESGDPTRALIGGLPHAVSPDLEVTFAGTQSGGPPLEYRGIDGLTEGWRELLTPWKSYVIEIEDIVDAGEDVITLVRGRGRTSRDDVEFEHRPAAVWTIHDGKIVAVAFYLERDYAFEATGSDN